MSDKQTRPFKKYGMRPRREVLQRGKGNDSYAGVAVFATRVRERVLFFIHGVVDYTGETLLHFESALRLIKDSVTPRDTQPSVKVFRLQCYWRVNITFVEFAVLVCIEGARTAAYVGSGNKPQFPC